MTPYYIIPSPVLVWFGSILDGIDFFLDYISSEIMGIIASRHLQLADQQHGTFHPDCLKLAQAPVSIQELLKVKSAKPDFMCPDYMLNIHKKSNEASGVLSFLLFLPHP
ncbi:hypothetical protein VP01_597g5 [Puccinia sorghi]|uniref:RNA-dependent RNA polymerase n=1 Tax=Puccinia sorghi TaxID=27349 RepID=A0A0L6UHJ5_9BASI|nr:hypothetical protein VP01_597g5 [Puccinia sorghi]